MAATPPDVSGGVSTSITSAATQVEGMVVDNLPTILVATVAIGAIGFGRKLVRKLF